MTSKAGRDLLKKAVLVPLLLFALWILQDDEASREGMGDGNHHLAFETALARHPPSRRVFRSLLEIDLLLWGVVVSLFVWSRTVGTKVVGHLLFQPASKGHGSSITSGMYQPVETCGEESDELWDNLCPEEKPGNENASTRKEGSVPTKKMLSEEEAWDAQNDSDGSYDPDVVQDMLELPEPPTAMAVARVALDFLLLILVSLFLFTLSSAEGGRYVDGMENIQSFKFIAVLAAPVFPLLLFIGVIVVLVFPWKKRKEFWTILSFTIGAPYYSVTFRDGFVGDILTSSVRPLQDIAFTVFYLTSGLRGWWQQSYGLDDADLPLESSWLLHTCVLPMCMVSPLWWRFLQNLRQSYEAKKRWPYLGNALKYFVAAEVAMFGVFDPSRKQTVLWLSCFVMATLYQVWWDVFMDWELLVVDQSGIRLRSTRIYRSRFMYWTIFCINFVLRFCWTLSFLPPHYLNRAGVLSNSFEGDLSHVLGPMIASAEIVRRTLWGLLRLEQEAIKVAERDPRLRGAYWTNEMNIRDAAKSEVELEPMKLRQGLQPLKQPMATKYGVWLSSDMSMLSDLQILGELCLWATAFTALGMMAAAHRMTF
jgi:hypothetical protein